MQPECDRPSATEINQVAAWLKQATDTGDSAAAFSAQRVKMCVQIGKKLIEWRKKIPRGQWESFLDDTLPDLPKATRCRWIRLADAATKGKLDIESARGLRHAYQLAGLLPDADSGGTKGNGKEVSYLVHVSRLVASLQHIDPSKLSVHERHALRERLNPVLSFMKKLDD